MPKGRPKLEPYTAISIRFPEALHAQITEAAAQCDPKMSFSSFVVKAVKEKLSGVHHHPETTVVVEAADTAPLLQRIAELEKRLETATQHEGDRLGEIEERLGQLKVDKRLDDFEYRLQSQIEAKLNIIRASIPKEQPQSDSVLLGKLSILEQEIVRLREELAGSQEQVWELSDRLEREIKQIDAVLEDDRTRQNAKVFDNPDAVKLVEQIAKHGEAKDAASGEKKSETEKVEPNSAEPTSDATFYGDEDEEEEASELETPAFTYGDWIRTSHDCLGWTCHRDPSLAVPRSLPYDERFMVLQIGEDWVKGMHVRFLSDRIVPLSLSPLKLYKKDIEVLEGDRDYYKSIFDEDGLFDEDDAEEQFNRVEKQLHGLPPAKGFGRKAG